MVISVSQFQMLLHRSCAAVVGLCHFGLTECAKHHFIRSLFKKIPHFRLHQIFL